MRGGSTSASSDSQTQTAGLDGSTLHQPRQVSYGSCFEYSLPFVVCCCPCCCHPTILQGGSLERVGGRLEYQQLPANSLLGGNRFGHEHEDLDPTPKAPSEPFRFTPSLLDPNSSAFAAFANQPPPGLFTPTPGGGNTLYSTHSHHDLQTPNVGISIGTPLSLPNTSTAMPRPTAGDIHDYNPQTIQPHQFHNYQPFTQSLHSGYLDPSHYHRPPSGPGSPMDVGDGADMMHEPGPLDGPPLDASALMSLEGKQYDHELAPHSSSERFVIWIFFSPSTVIFIAHHSFPHYPHPSRQLKLHRFFFFLSFKVTNIWIYM